MGKQIKESSTDEKEPTTTISVSENYDYVTVVGASYTSLIEDVRKQMGNKMRFVNQGIRQLRLYPMTTDDLSVQRVFLIFIEEYEAKLLKRIQQVVSGRYRAAYKEFDSISNLVDFVNLRMSKNRLIKQLDFFSHGVIGSVELGYKLRKNDSYRFRDVQARKLSPDAFDYDANIYSYACRTGLGQDDEDDPAYSKSLAQILANATTTMVHAFVRRSEYDLTYGDTRQRKIAADNIDKIRNYDNAIAAHRMLEVLQQKGVFSGPMPPRPVNPCTNEEESLARHAMSRDRNQRELGYPLDEEGAVQGVRTAATPEWAPQGLRIYSP